MIVERERERMAFVSAGWWDLVGRFAKADRQQLEAALVSVFRLARTSILRQASSRIRISCCSTSEPPPRSPTASAAASFALAGST
jgi:DNA topoisomerase IA